MSIWVLDKCDVTYLDEMLLDGDRLPKPVPYSSLVSVPITHIQQWANTKGVYTIPTVELIEWLRERTTGKKCIEICAGHGSIARHLGIVATDSYMQTTPEMVAYYRSIRQHPIQPPADVYKFEANEAVDQLRPELVLASFATQKYKEGDEVPPRVGSSIYGVDEEAMLGKIQTYVFVGNDETHADKRILKIPHETFRFPWLLTRSKNQEQNHIKVWHGNHHS
jgi:hypothetical protein